MKNNWNVFEKSKFEKLPEEHKNFKTLDGQPLETLVFKNNDETVAFGKQVFGATQDSVTKIASDKPAGIPMYCEILQQDATNLSSLADENGEIWFPASYSRENKQMASISIIPTKDKHGQELSIAIAKLNQCPVAPFSTKGETKWNKTRYDEKSANWAARETAMQIPEYVNVMIKGASALSEEINYDAIAHQAKDIHQAEDILRHILSARSGVDPSTGKQYRTLSEQEKNDEKLLALRLNTVYSKEKDADCMWIEKVKQEMISMGKELQYNRKLTQLNEIKNSRLSPADKIRAVKELEADDNQNSQPNDDNLSKIKKSNAPIQTKISAAKKELETKKPVTNDIW